MNLDTCTSAQRSCIRHLDGPLFIAAGAGSGKTFTLQQRIVYALLPESGPVCGSIDEVLAITFMEKAAEEVKSRVRGALLAEGMADEALKVDAAWISTIHGMCSRILRENALQAGLDPQFQTLSTFDAAQLRDEALERVLERERGNEQLAGLFSEYGARGPSGGRGGFSSNDSSVQGMLRRLLEKAASFSDGIAGIDSGPEPAQPSAVARRFAELYGKALELVEGAMGARPGKLQLRTRDACTAALNGLHAFLRDGDPNDFAALADVLQSLELPARNGFGSKANAAGRELVDELEEAITWGFDTVDAALARPHAAALMRLAELSEQEYFALLDAQSALDYDQLLHRTVRLLRDHPQVAAAYRARFKLVMVDEFQDTNQLQVDLISLVAGTSRLCTVGDAQQSIYRFNGADVGVFTRQQQRVRQAPVESHAMSARLDDNFRSHGDVLAFVRRVCGQGEVFGDDFLDLRASRVEKGRYKGRGPRVEVQITAYEGSKQESGVLEAQAKRVAERFAALRADGHEAGEMVVLVSRTTHVDVVAQALREQGFSCVLSGGRGFYATEEVLMVVAAMDALADPADTSALLSLLTSDVFQLSADDLLYLGTAFDDDSGLARSRSLDAGLRAVQARLRRELSCESDGGPGAEGRQGAPSAALAFAAQLLAQARGEVGLRAPADVLMGLLSGSGWLARMQAQGIEGISRAANALKAVRVVEQLQAMPGYGFAQVARDLHDMAATEADGPGSLSVTSSDAVRIMTIHKSKGLEFPIVAVLNCEPGGDSRGSFACDAVDGRVRMALSASRSKVDRGKRRKPKKRPPSPEEEPRTIDSAQDAADFSDLLAACSSREEVAEARRKFYVACTRASEYVLVCGVVKQGKDGFGLYGSTPILDDVRRALMGGEDFPDGDTLLDYGGSGPLLLARRLCGAEEDGQPSDASCDLQADVGGNARTMLVPAPDASVSAVCVPVPADVRAGMFSYSSIAAYHGLPPDEKEAQRGSQAGSDGEAARAAQAEQAEQAVQADCALLDEPGASDVPSAPDAPSATDLGSAFHRIAQLAVLRRGACGGLQLPPPERVEAVAAAYGAAQGPARKRLDGALRRWFACDVCARADSYDVVRSEVPFLARIDCDGKERLLDGEIDLLACDRDARRAFVVDYKTGGTDLETLEQLQRKHLLQATCYAYALLTEGFEGIEFAFVRVEHCAADDPSQPQVVPYRFEATDLGRVRSAVQEAYRAANK